MQNTNDLFSDTFDASAFSRLDSDYDATPDPCDVADYNHRVRFGYQSVPCQNYTKTQKDPFISMKTIEVKKALSSGYNVVVDGWYVVAWTDTNKKAKQIAISLKQG